MDLVTFYSARLDEKAQYARDLVTHGPANVSGLLSLSEQMLREVEAGRKILAEHKSVTKLADLTEQELGFLGWYREWVLKNLAAVYSDRPDYREEWAP